MISKTTDEKTIKALEDKCYKIRYDLLNFIYRIGMGHLGGELSMVEVAVALYNRYMKYDAKDPKWDERDRFVLSKAHCSETLYTIFSDLGMFTQDYMVEHFECLHESQFGMHCNRKYVPAIEVSAGSLGHGLPIAVGMALGARVQKKNWRTFVMVGDGELDEGTNWEALQAGAQFKLHNLIAICDKNQLQMTGPTEEIMAHLNLAEKVRAFGWNVIEIEDGNDMAQVCAALDSLPTPDYSAYDKPTFIISNTVKGKGVSFMEGNHKWHGGGIAKEQFEQAIASLKEKYGR